MAKGWAGREEEKLGSTNTSRESPRFNSSFFGVENTSRTSLLAAGLAERSSARLPSAPWRMTLEPMVGVLQLRRRSSGSLACVTRAVVLADPTKELCAMRPSSVMVRWELFESRNTQRSTATGQWPLGYVHKDVDTLLTNREIHQRNASTGDRVSANTKPVLRRGSNLAQSLKKKNLKLNMPMRCAR